jgi:perosamine synthetase
MHIPLSCPELTSADKAAVLEVLSSSKLSLGPKLPEFEAKLATVAGRRYAIAVNSGTSALHLCIKAAGLQEGDEVITTPFSFVASANCILFERAVPIFADIDPVTYNIDTAQIESLITGRTKAILPVHVFGRPCNIRTIIQLSRKYQLSIIEDACEAIGATYDGRPAGCFGQTGTFAFYPNKQITTGEGGVIVTDDERVADDCRRWRNQGRSASPHDRWLEHETLGYNYRLSDINCALGLSQLRRLEEVIIARSRIARLYDDALKDNPAIIRPPLYESGCDISWFVYVIRLEDHLDRDARNHVMRHLQASGVECRNYFPPIHLQPYYKRKFAYPQGSYPVTEHVSQRTIALPFFNHLSEGEVDYVCSTLTKALRSLAAKRRVWATAARVN